MTKPTVIRICLIGVGVISFAIGVFTFFYTKAHDIVVDPKVFTGLAIVGWVSVIATHLLIRRRKT